MESESNPLELNIGGKNVAKAVIIYWLVASDGSNLKLLETATGLPQKLLSPLLAELMTEKAVRLNKAIFKTRR